MGDKRVSLVLVSVGSARSRKAREARSFQTAPPGPLTKGIQNKQAERTDGIFLIGRELPAITTTGPTMAASWSTSLQRLRRLQALCSDVQCEAMVFVLGLDGRNNWGSAAVAKWLLGASSCRALS